MATDLETLVVRLEAQMRSYEKELSRQRGLTDRQLGAIEKRFKTAGTNISGTMSVITRGLGRQLAALGVVLSVAELGQLSEQVVKMQNSLKVAGLQGENLTNVYNQLFAAAQRNAAPVDSLVTLYGRLSQVQGELKVSQADMIRFSEGIALALRVAGTDATQASGALLQLSQAMAAGVVRAEEYNSINEGALPILQAVARGLEEAGGSVGKLRTLVTEGKVSSQAFFHAFLAGMPQLQQQAQTTQMTMGQALTLIQNAMLDTVGKLDKMLGSSQKMTEWLERIAKGIQTFGNWLTAVGGPIDATTTKINNLKDAILGVLAALARGPGRGFEGLDPVALGLEQSAANRINAGFAAFNRPTHRQAESEGFRGSVTVRPVSINDFPAAGKKDKEGSADRKDQFERAMDAARRRIAVTEAETAAIDKGAAAQDRARLVAELETAAKNANAAAGKKNTDVTAEQRTQIDALADDYLRVAQAAEAANGPLQRFGREAANVSVQLQDATLNALRSLEDAFVDVIMGTETVEEAFKKMANAIISDLIRISIRQAITGPLASAMGGMFGGGIPGFATGTRFAPGGLAMVGEEGPELVRLPRGSQVYPNNVTKQMVGGMQLTYAPVIDARGSELGEERVRQIVFEANRQLRRDIVPIVQDARSRRISR